MQQWRDQVREAKAEKAGWTAFKFQGDGIPPTADPDSTRSPATILIPADLTQTDLRRIGKAMETVREELGPDIDFGVEAHWRYDVRDAINMAKVLEPVKPMWLEDPVPPGNPDAMARVTHAVERPDLHRREPVHARRVPAAHRVAGMRYRAPRYSEIRRFARIEAHSRSG